VSALRNRKNSRNIENSNTLLIAEVGCFVKAVPSAQAATEAVPVVELPRDELPESGSYMLYIVPVKSIPPREAAPVLAPFSKMPNSVVAVDSSGLLLLRDYSTNIRRMLQVLDRIEAGLEPPAPPARR